MQGFIKDADDSETEEVQALRELVVARSVEGDEPSATVGWRSPLGGPRLGGGDGQ
ncbi:hypothetical protein [Natrialba aegyptia]|uniref:hypothetical protein n=1 Tax=Natrialba aegyptia TaxID=129789 RepID=UPI000AB8D612|nr:hypothetical protein [Natrialba aegyptia]